MCCIIEHIQLGSEKRDKKHQKKIVPCLCWRIAAFIIKHTQELCTFSMIRLHFEQKLWENIQDYNVSLKVYAFLPKQASCRQVSGKNLVNLCYTNPPITDSYSERVKISQVLHSKSESIYDIEQVKLTQGLISGKSLHLIFEGWFHCHSFHTWILLGFSNSLNEVQAFIGDCLVSPITFP